eukprot:768745-Hanusia_phi.AAC.2
MPIQCTKKFEPTCRYQCCQVVSSPLLKTERTENPTAYAIPAMLHTHCYPALGLRYTSHASLPDQQTLMAFKIFFPYPTLKSDIHPYPFIIWLSPLPSIVR